MSKLTTLITIARALRRLEEEAARAGLKDLALIIGTAGLLAQDIAQVTDKKH